MALDSLLDGFIAGRCILNRCNKQTSMSSGTLSITRSHNTPSIRMMSDPDLRAPFFMKPLSSLSARGTRAPHLLRELNAELSRVAAAFLKVEQKSERDAV